MKTRGFEILLFFFKKNDFYKIIQFFQTSVCVHSLCLSLQPTCHSLNTRQTIKIVLLTMYVFMGHYIYIKQNFIQFYNHCNNIIIIKNIKIK